jgi:hypothetical protein
MQHSCLVPVAILMAFTTIAGAPSECASAEEPAPTIRLERVGTSFTTGGSGETPIYSVALGSPERGELLAWTWSAHYGMHAVDGTLWVRETPGDSTRWKRVTLRRPRSVEEIRLFAARPGAFQDETHGDRSILPAPFRGLSRAELASLEYIVRYAAGGTRALFHVGTTEDQAEAVAASLRRLLRQAAPSQ